MSLTVEYRDLPPGAVEHAAFSSGPCQPFGSAEGLKESFSSAAFATLERGGWPLDGSRQLFADAPEGIGWWSAAPSGPDGSFTQPPTLTLQFSMPYTATGLTFSFWSATGEYCSHLAARWYRGAVLLAEREGWPDGSDWTLDETVESFDRIELRLLAASGPGRYAKLEKLLVGQLRVLAEDEIVSASLVNEADPGLAEITLDTSRIVFHDRKNRSWMPQENQELCIYQDGRLLAVHYLEEFTRSGERDYTFSALSVIAKLSDDFLGGLYDAAPLCGVLDELLGDIPYELDAAFAEMTITGWLPVCTRREALQQIAFAVGALCTTQGSAAIRLLPLPGAVSSVILGGEIFAQDASLTLAARVSRVEVTAHRYIPLQEPEELLSEEFEGEGALITFDEPHHEYEITGGVLEASGANWVRITANGPVTLTGCGYRHGTRLHIKRNSSALASEMGNAVKVTEATLVGPHNAADVLARLYQRYMLRQTMTEKILAGQRTAGELVLSINSWGGQTRGYLTRLERELTRGGQTAAVTILGEQVERAAVWRYSGEVLAGEFEGVY